MSGETTPGHRETLYARGMKMRIYVFGSLAYDRIMDFPERFSDHILPDKIHVLNVCFMVNGLEEQFGGTAGNIAYSLSLLGERPLVLATAGKDFGNYADRLTSLGLSLDGVTVIDHEFTAGAYITTDKADNQITGFNMGAMRHSCSYKPNGADCDNALAIVAPGNVEDMRTYAGLFKELRIPYICDPGQSIPAQTPEALVDMITGAKLLISNDYELELIMRATGLDMTRLLERTSAVITTLGENGSRVTTAAGETSIPAVAPDAVLDPTGAGDAYRAGLLKGFADGLSLEDSPRMGAVCASFSVEHRGAQRHGFTQKRFRARRDAAFGPRSG
jgi:adenosine kinase